MLVATTQGVHAFAVELIGTNEPDSGLDLNHPQYESL